MSILSPQFIDELWYGKHPLSLILAPLSWLFSIVVLIRRVFYTVGILPVQRIPIPVIVVGNISVGGTGKTPLIIWLAEFLQASGYKPGVVSRGYGANVSKRPQQVRPDSNPLVVGDEPVLIAQRTKCPVAVSPNRLTAAKALIEHMDCDALLCDDGLQHYALYRDIEIAMIDGVRRFGNARCLPAGPLREPISRLNKVDMIVNNGGEGKNEYTMTIIPLHLTAVHDETIQREIESLSGMHVHAVAGIGNPNRFFSLLRNMGINVIRHVFPDHYEYQVNDIVFHDELPVVMTEKDAVKCRNFAGENTWYLPIEAKMTDAFKHRLTVLLREVTNG